MRKYSYSIPLKKAQKQRHQNLRKQGVENMIQVLEPMFKALDSNLNTSQSTIGGSTIILKWKGNLKIYTSKEKI